MGFWVFLGGFFYCQPWQQVVVVDPLLLPPPHVVQQQRTAAAAVGYPGNETLTFEQQQQLQRLQHQ